MVCSNCGNANDNDERFCRACGVDLLNKPALQTQQSALQTKANAKLAPASKDPDELMGNGIGSVIMGDGFLLVGVILSAVESSISSMLWLLLLIPAFVFFGKGFADVLHAKQIRRRLTDQLPASDSSPATLADVFQNRGSGELTARPSVTERTTRQLK